MGTSRLDCEFRLFELDVRLYDELAELAELPKMPTVCLLAADVLRPSLDLSELVERLVPAGCRYFMTWGAAAEELHDVLDELLEARGGDFLAVVTASHKGEPVEDVAWFMVNAAFPGESRLRCCVGYRDRTAGVSELLKAVRTAVSTRS